MACIVKIKEELSKISPWPWGWHKDVPKRVLGKGIVIIVAECREEHDAKFLVSAPARIAKLIAVAEAAQNYYDDVESNLKFKAEPQQRHESGEKFIKALAALEADDGQSEMR